MDISISKKTVANGAKRMAAYLNDINKSNIKHQTMLNAIAVYHGYSNYNTFLAALNNNSIASGVNEGAILKNTEHYIKCFISVDDNSFYKTEFDGTEFFSSMNDAELLDYVCSLFDDEWGAGDISDKIYWYLTKDAQLDSIRRQPDFCEAVNYLSVMQNILSPVADPIGFSIYVSEESVFIWLSQNRTNVFKDFMEYILNGESTCNELYCGTSIDNIIEKARRVVAEQIFENIVFDGVVAEHNGWSFIPTKWQKTIFVENDNPKMDSTAYELVVEFLPHSCVNINNKVIKLK